MAPVLLLALAALAGPLAGDSPPGWKAGAATVNITPRKSMWMTGYGMRRKPSQGTLQDLHAKALALEDPAGRRAVLVASDLLGFPATVAASISREAEKRWRLERDPSS